MTEGHRYKTILESRLLGRRFFRKEQSKFYRLEELEFSESLREGTVVTLPATIFGELRGLPEIRGCKVSEIENIAGISGHSSPLPILSLRLDANTETDYGNNNAKCAAYEKALAGKGLK